MGRKISKITIVLILAIIGFACSRKKDKFVNRAWHDVTTKNNTLYNGRLAFDTGKEDIIQSYKDNFWELLPIERMIVSEDVRLPNEVLNKNFDRAEEKAVKAIQKHSMLIDGKERNPKIDEAFLLLGKARYFEQRFVPALEAFNYILYKYPSSNTINHAKVWKAKTNLRLDNNEKAIEDLTRMIEQEYMKPQDYADALAMMAQACVNLKKKDSAVTYITKAAIHTQKNEEKGRYLYIKGQLLNQLGYKDSANYAFDQVIDLNRRAPRRYMMNAYMAKARNFEYNKGNNEEFLELLTDLEENRENRPFLDKIYNQKAVYFKTLDSIDLAVDYYNKSLRTKSEDKYLESLNYYTLGDISFDRKEYAVSGAYYDSTLQRMIVDSKRYRVLKKKRDNLDDVILYEGIANTNDSILTVFAMSPDDRLAYYTTYTNGLKEKAIAAEKAEEIARIKEGLPTEQRFKQPGSGFGKNNNNAEAKGGPFYFYNQTTVAYGKTSFKRTYGNRELEDNWRVSSISNPNAVSAIEEKKEEKYSIDTDPTFDPQTYIAQLPTDPASIDSLETDRNFAYYQLGVIYKEKFQEYDLAIDKFESLLQNSPEERLVIPSKYNLYKIYLVQGNSSKSNALMQDIINNHTDSRYAKILQNPDEALKDDQNSPKSIYNKLYKGFQDQKYASVIKESDEMIVKFGGDEDFLPKFELLKAQAIGRFRGFNAYKEALNYVSLNYPQSPEGKKAQMIYQVTIPQIENDRFLTGLEEEKNHKVIYPFSTFGDNQAQGLKEHVQAIIEELRYDKMKVSLDKYNKDQQFVVVHTKGSKLAAEGLAELLSLGRTEDTRGVDLTKWNRKKKYYKKVDATFFIIASPNYRILQIHKNLEEYKPVETQLETE
ncbi:type IX secretion system periplasmic lipoprotein PorW/SprE [Aquimarina sediminis]|uniref:type IX secretion system periplasmic lipoprotein PorW/SprE n=1 Tax=Aquimarina sediminis TaxID=2070536 RepID=UPI000CA04E26|nr:tetratricopeptide repeat protein [Aquimarina sediminis]